ncbi:MAG: PD-(D/E)XK nuclease family protein [Bdellovibrionaceae bacterium]|nr:PD-(D/E)XK nuclease family protein [Bdellovibrio sp.]
MLEFLKVQHPDQIKTLLKDFDPHHQTWIVSDLKSKKEIQNESILRLGYYTDDAILQVSDFWQIWLRRLEPTLHVVSSDFIRTLVQLFIDQYSKELDMAENDVSTLDRSLQELAPLLLHPESDSLLKEWMQGQSEDRKWTKWYLLARTCLKFIVNEKKVIDKKWTAAYLQTIDITAMTWDRELIIDLGTELTSIEMGLFKTLSQKQTVKICVPDPTWAAKFPYLLKTYNENLGYGTVESLPTVIHEIEPAAIAPEFVRLSTQLAEIKFAVAQVRQWVEAENILPNQIAIMAPNIEEYWPVLEYYLNEEGIPFQKEVVAPLNSLGDVQTLLSHLKNMTQDVSWDSLEKNYFQALKLPAMKFEHFKSLFYQIYDDEDLKRDEKIQSLYYKKIDYQAELNRDEFLSLLVRVWSTLPDSKNLIGLFESVFKDLLSQSLNIPMKFNRWYQFLKSRLSRKEIKVLAASSEGLTIIPMMWSQMITASHRIYLGLYEEAFRKVRRSILPLKDIETLKNQFDLALDYPDESHLDFNLRWQSLASCQKKIYTTPHLSFSADPLTACLYFLENNPTSAIVSPHLTRVDELQKELHALNLDPRQEINPGSYAGLTSAKRIGADIHGAEITIQSEVFKTVSVSEIENYAKCAFKLLASKGFRLRELPYVSIDLDPRQKGTLAHALFEYSIGLIRANEFTLAKISQFLDERRHEANLYMNEDLFWNIQKDKMLTLAQKFYDFESIHKEKFKSETEVDIEIYYDFDKGNFTTVKTANGIGLRGRIDRVDHSIKENYIIIYDYKSSAGRISNHPKWLSEYEFQLLIYTLALEAVYAESIPVKGALYYLYKTFDLSKGFVEKDIGLAHFGLSKANKSLTDNETHQKLKEEFIKFMGVFFENLKKGHFQTRPFKTDICIECDWRKLCRAPHLN